MAHWAEDLSPPFYFVNSKRISNYDLLAQSLPVITLYMSALGVFSPLTFLYPSVLEQTGLGRTCITYLTSHMSLSLSLCPPSPSSHDLHMNRAITCIFGESVGRHSREVNAFMALFMFWGVFWQFSGDPMGPESRPEFFSSMCLITSWESGLFSQPVPGSTAGSGVYCSEETRAQQSTPGIPYPLSLPIVISEHRARSSHRVF